MGTPANPVELVRKLAGDVLQRCGNAIRVEDGGAVSCMDDTAHALRVVDTAEPWELYAVYDIADDSDEAFVVPAGYEYQVLEVGVVLTTSATVGNRQLAVQWYDAAGHSLGEVRAGAVQAASLTRSYTLAPGLADLAAFRDTNYLMSPLPAALFLSAGESLRIYDNKAVDVPGDALTASVRVARRQV